MKPYRWEIDDQTVIEAQYSTFTGKEEIFVNDKLVSSKRNFGFKSQTEFNIDSYRKGLIKVNVVGIIPEAELTINGKFYLHNLSGIQVFCPHCNTKAKLNDSFCGTCGSQLEGSEAVLKDTKVKEASKMILVLSVIFLIYGVSMFFIQKGTYDNAIINLSSLNATDVYPNLVNGKSYTVEQLRNQIYIEKWGLLGLNVFLATLLFILYRWSKKAPLPAIIVASSIYLAIIVLNALIDPKTIAQGIFLKVIIITMLYKGIKAALASKSKMSYAKI